MPCLLTMTIIIFECYFSIDRLRLIYAAEYFGTLEARNVLSSIHVYLHGHSSQKNDSLRQTSKSGIC